jgi:hypothetical protein
MIVKFAVMLAPA